MGFGSATLVDAEKFCRQFLPDEVPDDFGALAIPLTVIATDLYRRQQVGVLVRRAQAGARRLDRAADRDAAGGDRRTAS